MARENSSFDHRIARISDAPAVERREYRPPWPPGAPIRVLWDDCCSIKTCRGKVAFVVAWDYASGSRGNVMAALRLYCQEHGERFCRQHGIPLEGIPETTWGHRWDKYSGHDWAKERPNLGEALPDIGHQIDLAIGEAATKIAAEIANRRPEAPSCSS